ncbi:MAG TPA: CopG family transcriptional regulator [Anaerolineae bacterium]|nr:CopG family transcriptional regulator [Anaerolineae bacterium]
MQIKTLEQFETVRTTVTLPVELMRRSQEIVESGLVPNRNALIVAAMEHFIAELEREEIDRQFAAMANDEAFQTLQLEVAESFADSDWEALRQGESQLQ